MLGMCDGGEAVLLCKVTPVILHGVVSRESLSDAFLAHISRLVLGWAMSSYEQGTPEVERAWGYGLPLS